MRILSNKAQLISNKGFLRQHIGISYQFKNLLSFSLITGTLSGLKRNSFGNTIMLVDNPVVRSFIDLLKPLEILLC